MGKLTQAERRENRIEFAELVRQAEVWATTERHPYRHDYLCTIMYIKARLKTWRLERVDQVLKASLAARERRNRDATWIALGSAIGGVGIAGCSLVFSSLSDANKLLGLPLVCLIVGVVTVWLVGPRVGYDRERIREREWNSVVGTLNDRRVELLNDPEGT